MTPAISVAAAVKAWIGEQNKDWAHDRSQTIGASEIGQCVRRMFFEKNGIARDEDFEDSRGAAMRGDLIEQHIWVPAMRAAIEEAGGKLLGAGDEQLTIADGYLSATPDGIVTGLGKDFLVECKSIDPRVDLDEAKQEHRYQVQVQMGLIRDCTEYQPAYAIISYIDASFCDRVEEYVVPFDAPTYARAKDRALKIMDAREAADLRPEGKMAGGKECAYCPWSSHCADVQAPGFPKNEEQPLNENAQAALEQAMREAVEHGGIEKDAKERAAAAKEEIKEIMRAHKLRRIDTETGSVSWSYVKPRERFDIKAAEKAGLDLSPFKSEGSPSERLTIKQG